MAPAFVGRYKSEGVAIDTIWEVSRTMRAGSATHFSRRASTVRRDWQKRRRVFADAAGGDRRQSHPQPPEQCPCDGP